MKIFIEYQSSWRNSFFNGSNNEALPKKGREFIGSMTNLRNEENYRTCDITIDTVMGVLNRLIGDQRKLYQARDENKYGYYYFKNIEPHITFVDKPAFTSNEVVYLRNMNGSTDQNSFTGMIKFSDPMFNSDYSTEFWGVLALSFDELCDFITHKTKVSQTIPCDPMSIILRLEMLNKDKPVANQGAVNTALRCLQASFPDTDYLNKNGDINPIMFYCSSLYLQLERLSARFNMSSAKTKSGGISGISKRGFTKKDFMAKFTTGPKKKIWGNPYIKKQRIKGQGEVTSMLIKASGTLEIEIDVDEKKAQEIKSMIDNAGVSSFYLGKKGLAYVSKLRI